MSEIRRMQNTVYKRKPITQIVAETKAYACLECGKCTAVCPISHYDPEFSPRMLVYNAIHGHDSEVLQESQLWACLTCVACEAICQSGVRYAEFIKGLRGEAHELGMTGQCTHGGALQSLMHIMTSDELKQNRLGWLPKQLKTATTSDTFYFVGCAPYFDTFFADLGVRTLSAAKGAIALLNRLDIVPALAPNERCCGHDMLWGGDVENFLKLAQHNVQAITETGAKRVVITCPEGYQTLKNEYPRYLGNLGFEVIHLSELIAERVSSGDLKFSGMNKKVTYHDPCRLGRFSGIYDEPRTILEAIPGLELVEMDHNRATALCCGTQFWMNCGAVSKQIQAELLREAKGTGADVLVTACPKCQIHLKCAMHDEKLGEELQMEIQDIAGLVASALAKE